MKSYPLARLLALREHKAETAKAEVGRRRRLLEEAREAAREADATAKNFADRRPAEEAALFAIIRNQVLERKRLDRYHEDIAALAARELELYDRAAKEREKAAKAEEALEQALAVHKEAVRDVSKFEEHRAIWWEAEKRRREEIQELEAEETAGIAALRRNKH